jgi:cytosine/uracil/thiamine/allantoin permease
LTLKLKVKKNIKNKMDYLARCASSLLSGTSSLERQEQPQLTFWQSVPVMVSAVALVVSYFSGPMLNFGDFSRYARSWRTVQWGNFLGLFSFY